MSAILAAVIPTRNRGALAISFAATAVRMANSLPVHGTCHRRNGGGTSLIASTGAVMSISGHRVAMRSSAPQLRGMATRRS